MSDEPINELHKILCPFCSEPWDEKNIKLFNIACDYYESMGPCDFTADLEISCHKCKRVMYEKEEIPEGI